jgi:hypothetical protein
VNCPWSQRCCRKKEAKKQKTIEQKSLKTIESRKHLQNVRVVQKNLVYVTGLPSYLADEEVCWSSLHMMCSPPHPQSLLMSQDYFGQFGKVFRIVINRNSHYNSGPAPTVGAYVTFARKEDAAACVRGIGRPS